MSNMAGKRNARRRFAGVSMLEVSLGLGLLSLGLVAGGRAVNESIQANRAVTAAGRLGDVSSAANDYVRTNRAALIALAPVGGRPVSIPTGRTTPGAALPAGPGGLPSVQGGGFLPSTFVDANNYGQNHRLLVRQPTAGVLEYMVVQFGGRTIPDQDLSRVTQRIGAAGGAVLANPPASMPAGTIMGTGGGWRSTLTEWTATDGTGPTVGRAAVTNTYSQSTGLADYLYRNDIGIAAANQMNTALDMTGKDINRGGVITSQQSIMNEGGRACLATAVNCTFWIADAGGFTSTHDGWLRLIGAPGGRGLAITGPGDASLNVQNDVGIGRDLFASRNAIVGGTLTVNGYANFQDGASVRNSLGVGQDLSVGGNTGIGGSLGVTNTIYAGGNITSGGTVVGNGGLVSGGGLTVAGNAGIGGGLWANYIASNGNMDVGGSLGVAGNIVSGAAVTAAYMATSGDLDVGGNQRTAGTITAGNDIVGNRNIRAGDSVIANNRVIGVNGVQTLLVANVNDGCGDLGMLARNSSDGAFLFCEAGVWKSPGAPFTENVASWSVGSGFSWVNSSAKTALINVNGNSGGRCNMTSFVNGVPQANTYILMSGGSANCQHNVVVPPGGRYDLGFGNNVFSADLNVWR